MIRQFRNHLVETLSGFSRCRGFLLPQFQEIVVILQLFLETEEFLVGKNHKFLATVLLNDLRMKRHGMSAVGFTAMKYTVHDDPISRDFKQGSPIARSHPVLGREIREPFHIAPQIVLQKPKPLDHSFPILPTD
jgi:hypothetical protein